MADTITLNVYAYVLECECNKYYIGIAYDLKKRIKIHVNQSKHSAVFTKLYKPIKCIICYDLNTKDWEYAEKLENYLVIEYCKKYGIENVAGGIFSMRDDKVRAKSILNFKRKYNTLIDSFEKNTYKNLYIIQPINIHECLNEAASSLELISFDAVEYLTKDILLLKKRLVIIISLIYHVKPIRVVKMKISHINRKEMTISIPNKKNGVKSFPMDQKLLKMMEDYYKLENVKPIDYFFASKYDVNVRMGLSDEPRIVKQLKNLIKK